MAKQSKFSKNVLKKDSNVLKKTTSKKPKLSIDEKCLWELCTKNIPENNPFFNNVDDIVSLLESYIEIIPKKRKMLADITIDINILNDDNTLLVTFSFLSAVYFSINIWKFTTGEIKISYISEKFEQGGGIKMPLPDWYASFLSVCNCIYSDIYDIIHK